MASAAAWGVRIMLRRCEVDRQVHHRVRKMGGGIGIVETVSRKFLMCRKLRLCSHRRIRFLQREAILILFIFIVLRVVAIDAQVLVGIATAVGLFILVKLECRRLGWLRRVGVEKGCIVGLHFDCGMQRLVAPVANLERSRG